MVGVNISIVDQLIGTITNEDGSFTLTTQVTPPFTIVVSMMGFQNQEIEIESALSNLDIGMDEQVYLGQEVVVSASRITESILKSPVSIEKINALQLQQSTSANFYDGLYNLKGVDMNIHSLTFRYPNTRGFTGDANYRMNQIIDGIENIPPGMSFSAGNIFGLSQLDVQSLELLVGASSALYGPGGMNGTLIMTSKNPYDFQGLSFTSQAGIMNINAAHPDGANPMGEFSFRYAKAFNDKLAIKITAGYLTATDWHAYDLRNKNDFNNPNATRLTNPGYDGINVYGDDIIVPVNLKDVAPQVAAGVAETRGLIPGTIEYDQEVQRIVDLFPDQVISRSGWQEKELVDYGTNNMRIGGSVHYRFNERFEAFVQGNYAQGTSVYTAQNRFSLKNFNIYTARAEIKSPDFFLRAYTTVDNSGDSFDAGGAALKLNEAWKPSEQWFTEYIENFATMLLMGNSEEASHQFARTVADNRDVNGNIFNPDSVAFPKPGTDYFNELYDPIINTPVSTGAQVLDKSKIVHAEGMYNLTRFVKIFDLVVGSSIRFYSIDSDGTIFFDLPDKPISIWQVGSFLQVSREVIQERLKVTASARYDKNEYFDGRITPRFSAVFTMDKNQSHNLRASAQTAFRFPSIADQWLDLNVGPYQVIGGLPEVQSKYNMPENPVYPLSGTNAITDEPVIENGPYHIPKFRPEQVRAIEAGYKGLILNKKLLIDTYVFSNKYSGFQATQVLAQNPFTEDEKRFLTIISTDFPVTSYGWAVGADYRTTRAFILSGNVSFNDLAKISDAPPGFLTKFNTPRFRVNAGLGNRRITRCFGFNLNYRWQESFIWESTFGVGEIPAFATLDAQVSFSFPEINSTFKVGGSNMLNDYYTTSYGSAQVGGMYYFTWTFDEIMN